MPLIVGDQRLPYSAIASFRHVDRDRCLHAGRAGAGPKTEAAPRGTRAVSRNRGVPCAAEKPSSGGILRDRGHGGIIAQPLATEVAPPEEGRLVNLSVLHGLTPADPALLMGLTIARGVDGPKPVLVRAAGPALTGFGVANPLPDPRLVVLRAGGVTMTANDNWAGSAPVAAGAARLGAFPFGTTSLDAAAVVSLDHGNYNLQVTASDLSAATGPSLAQFGVSGALLDPQLALYAGATLHALNDDWGGGPVLTEVAARVGAFPLVAASRDAALLVTLAPGQYSAHLRGANATSGIVLLEIYELEP